MAPVRRRLVATWREEGSSEVAKMEGVDGGSSMGPSSAVVMVVGSGSSASHVWGLERRWAEREWRVVGL